jgi:protein O-GlcNAc transferase
MRAMESVARAIELYRRGSVREAEALCEMLLAQDGRAEQCLALLADIRLSTGRAAEAIAALTALTRLIPDDAATLRRLGAALLTASRAGEAVAAFERAIELEPDNVRAYNNLGQALLQTENIPGAIRRFERALALDPAYAIGYSNLGLALARVGKFDEAVAALQRAVGIDASLVVARLNLGAALEHLGRLPQALDVYEHIVNRWPERFDAWIALGALLFSLNRPMEALHALETAVAIEPEFVKGWCDLAVVHQNLGDDGAAVRCLRRAIAVDDGCALARSALIAAHIPSIARSEAESSAARRAFELELDAFEGWLRSQDLTEADAWTVARQQFFYLSYQEYSNKPLLERYRRASAERLTRVGYYDDGPVNVGDRSSRRFKLGFVSAQFYDHSVFNAIVQGWLQGLDRRRFEISLFSLGTKRDATTEAAAAAVDHFDAASRTTAEWADTLARQHLDAVIFPEIGIDRNTLALAGLSLAHRQFVAWGHPETSGLPTIDEFLSADAFEPEGAEDHYSERLVRLPHLGVYYEPFAAEPTPVDLARLGIPDDVPLLICPGTPFKYRPQDDAVWVEIARRLGRCTFAFFQHERAELSNKLRRRLTDAFARAGLDAGRFLVFLPWLPRAEFLGLMRRADVYLDTLGFSGFNTFMQAVQAHLPGVALEGRFMRGRLGSGILRHLGLAEFVAATPADYVAIAVKLAEDPAHRARVRAALRERETRAYRDLCVVEALSEVLLR